MKFTNKEKIVLSIVMAVWGVFLIGSGLVMQKNIKPIIHTDYTLKVSSRKIPVAQAKTNEIKIKDITIEINNPISVKVKDYLEDADKLEDEVLNSLKLDTSLVNINQAGEYQYTITYKKKKYIGKITVKEKELPNMSFTLKTVTIKLGDALSENATSYINETSLPEEVVKNLHLDLRGVNKSTAGIYTYYITYKDTRYQGQIIIQDNNNAKLDCPTNSVYNGATCVCNDISKKYDEKSNYCIDKEQKQEQIQEKKEPNE